MQRQQEQQQEQLLGRVCQAALYSCLGLMWAGGGAGSAAVHAKAARTVQQQHRLCAGHCSCRPRLPGTSILLRRACHRYT